MPIGVMNAVLGDYTSTELYCSSEKIHFLGVYLESNFDTHLQE